MKKILVSLALTALSAAGVMAAEAPWKLDEWRKVPEVFPVDPASFEFNVPENVTPLYYTGADYQGRETRVFAWMGVPEVPEGETVPAMVLVHGGGGSAFAEWVAYWNRRGYAAIAMDQVACVPTAGFEGAGIRKGHDFMPGPGDVILDNSLPPADRWPYHAASSVMLAHSLIAAQPGVDPDRIGLTGISWGAVVTCIVSGLDDRFAFAAPVYGCGYINEQQPLYGGTPQAVVQEWFDLWDPVNYLPKAGMPMIFISGATDYAFALDSWERSVELPAGKVVRSMRAVLPHSHRSGLVPEVTAFADSILKGENVLPEIEEIKIEEGILKSRWSNAFEIAGVELVYTDGVSADLKTVQQSNDCLNPQIWVQIPADAVSGWLNIRTLDGCVISSARMTFK